jgi:hypothetical protein
MSKSLWPRGLSGIIGAIALTGAFVLAAFRPAQAASVQTCLGFSINGSTTTPQDVIAGDAADFVGTLTTQTNPCGTGTAIGPQDGPPATYPTIGFWEKYVITDDNSTSPPTLIYTPTVCSTTGRIAWSLIDIGAFKPGG